MTLATSSNQATDASYARLRELIMDAELLPNSLQTVKGLAARTGFDEEAIEHATARLAKGRLVRINPSGGFWVGTINPSDVVDTFQQISMLEARAAFVVALHSAASIEMAALDDSILRMKDALFRSNPGQWARANHHFHRSLVQCSGHTGLISAALAMSEGVHRARMLGIQLGPLPIETTESHASLVEAIRNGFAIEARDIHLAYWRAAGISIAELIEQYGFDRPVS